MERAAYAESSLLQQQYLQMQQQAYEEGLAQARERAAPAEFSNLPPKPALLHKIEKRKKTTEGTLRKSPSYVRQAEQYERERTVKANLESHDKVGCESLYRYQE